MRIASVSLSKWTTPHAVPNNVKKVLCFTAGLLISHTQVRAPFWGKLSRWVTTSCPSWKGLRAIDARTQLFGNYRARELLCPRLGVTRHTYTCSFRCIWCKHLRFNIVCANWREHGARCPQPAIFGTGNISWCWATGWLLLGVLEGVAMNSHSDSSSLSLLYRGSHLPYRAILVISKTGSSITTYPELPVLSLKRSLLLVYRSWYRFKLFGYLFWLRGLKVIIQQADMCYIYEARHSVEYTTHDVFFVSWHSTIREKNVKRTI